MNTEITDTVNTNTHNWVCYDADCARCVRWTGRIRGALKRRGFVLMPLQSAEVREVLRVPDEELLKEMKVVTVRGEIFGGAEAVVYLGGRFFKPVLALAAIPGVMRVLHVVYRFVARHRYCGEGVCRNLKGTHGRDARTTIFRVGNPADWLPLLVLPPAAAVIGRQLPAWIYMWVLAFALFIGCKWICLRKEIRRTKQGENVRVNFGVEEDNLPPADFIPRWKFVRWIGFLFGWVGMDAADFLAKDKNVAKPKAREWFFAGLKIFLGAILIWAGVRAAMGIHPLVAGWIGMLGIIFLVHFGVFHLLALAWRAAGVDAKPLMRAPLLSQSVGEFWGYRWNTAFNQLVATFLFRPLHRGAGVGAATMIVFLVSGLLHEFVISLPARGGYGLPTFYFLLQGAGVLFEHTPFARRLGLGHGIRGWLFALIVTAGPAFWLFHPPFVYHVILPMLRAIGAT